MRRIAAFLLIALVSAPLYAYRREYRVTLDGNRKAGSEVCFYDGVSGHNPFELFFSQTAARCLPADDIIDIPPGLFHVFARHHDGFVSEHRDYIVYRGAAAPEAGYHTLDIPLSRAAYLDFSAVVNDLRAGESAGVWIAQTPERAGTFFPLVNGETSMLVPADGPLVPLLISNHHPIAVGAALDLPAGAHERLTPFRDRAAVVAWASPDRAAIEATASSLTTPDVTLTIGNQHLKPLFPLYHVESPNTLVVFANVPAGNAHVELHGRFWRTAQQNVTVPQRGAVAVNEPLMMQPAGSLVVTWTSDRAVAPAGAECHTEIPAGLRTPMRAAIERCSTPEQCERVAVKAADADATDIEFHGLAPGHYRVLFRAPGVNQTMTRAADVVASRESTVTIPFESSFGVFGTVTLNGDPIPARIFFDTGEAVSDDTGRYTASLTGDPRTALIRVLSCSDGRVHTFIPHDSMHPNANFDIALHIVTANIAVHDDHGLPVPQADVWYAAVKNEDSTFYTAPKQKTDASGSLTIDSIPADQTIRVCGAKAGYITACTAAQAKTALVLHSFAMQGKVTNHDGAGFIGSVDAQGHLTELAQIAPDGSFAFRQLHAPPEYLVYTSSVRPLSVVPLIADPDTHQLTVTVPEAPARSFTVSVPATGPDGFVGLWVGNEYVPLQMLAFHEEARGQNIVIRHAGRLQFRDILETAPLSVGFAPASKEVTDVFTLPQYAGMVRQRVTQADVVLNH